MAVSGNGQPPGPKLLLFDVDGTLVLTGGAGVRAMSRAFEETFGQADAFEGIPMAGRTDRHILTDALDRVRIAWDQSQVAGFRECYHRCLREEIRRPGPRKGVMPGVRALLDALASRDDVFLALLTGNFAEAARIKLEYFDLWRYFLCGAYADDAGERNELVAVAVARAGACGLTDVTASDIVVIGDTPLDVTCAVSAGARSVAVATGGFDAESLRASGADVVFEDLGRADEFLRLLDDWTR